ncbi:PREDICTED: protein yellow-like [Ceratosolen solmsi marchali]|uniref:Protein yellow-like n=1 Tax=Ceratosolen solmsi marchali TaxID=326594 RepID=A0AAJ6VKZ6_9HYME|nr:PREDICTED: protein yellow-like [Ceratosolen solmsi marchali]
MRLAGLNSLCYCLAVFETVATCYKTQPNDYISKLRNVYSWKSLDFVFPNDVVREAAIRSGRFKPGAAIPIDVDVYYGVNPVVFMAIPRLEQGVPIAIGYVTDAISKEGNPLIAPYPSWEWNKLGDCDAITSAYRIQIDECGRLWVLDTGVIGDQRVCRPQLLSFCLTTNKLLSRYRFPRDQYNEKSLFVTPLVDVRTIDVKCRDTFVYIADVTSFSLIVYDHINARSWKINNNLFYPYPQHGTFEIRNEAFDLMDGILGMALSPMSLNGDRILYFHSLASTTESWVSTSVIRNFTLFEKNPDAAARSFKAFPMQRTSQSAAESMDANGVLFFGLMSELSIACWNTKHFPEFGGKNIETLVIDEETLQFASGLKVVRARTGRQEIWVSTAAFQRYMSGTLHPNETNFRIQAGFVDELVRGTKCDVPALDIYNQNTGQFLTATK